MLLERQVSAIHLWVCPYVHHSRVQHGKDAVKQRFSTSFSTSVLFPVSLSVLGVRVHWWISGSFLAMHCLAAGIPGKHSIMGGRSAAFWVSYPALHLVRRKARVEMESLVQVVMKERCCPIVFLLIAWVHSSWSWTKPIQGHGCKLGMKSERMEFCSFCRLPELSLKLFKQTAGAGIPLEGGSAHIQWPLRSVAVCPVATETVQIRRRHPWILWLASILRCLNFYCQNV